MKQFWLLLAFFSFITPTYAQDQSTTQAAEDLQKRQEEFAKNMAEASKEFQKNIKEFSKDVTAAIPVVTRNLSDMMNTFTGEMMPIMAAVNKNKQLLEASDSMAQSIQASLPMQYQQNINYDINQNSNELSVSAIINRNNDQLAFNISRNLAATLITQMIIEDTNRIEEHNFYNKDKPLIQSSRTITDLKDKKLNLNQFKLDNFNENVFMCYDNDQSQESFIFGNIGPLINVRVQTTGPNHAQNARDFIKSLDKTKIQKAVGINEQNQKTIKEYEKEIRKEAADPKNFLPLINQK